MVIFHSYVSLPEGKPYVSIHSATGLDHLSVHVDADHGLLDAVVVAGRVKVPDARVLKWRNFEGPIWMVY